jgi:CheY-like chemotaxis protein
MFFENQIPICYYPTQIVSIDDDTKFLKIIERILGHFSLTKFTSPSSGIDYINETPSQSYIQQAVAPTTSDDDSIKSMEINLENIYKLNAIKEKQQEVSVLVIDYEMPQGMATEFTPKINNKGTKRLMLTGVGDHHFAINALNEGFIDVYLSKQNEHADKELLQYVEKLEMKYFVDQSQAFLDHYPRLKQLLTNETIINLFSEICKQYNIQSFYLANNLGAFILFDTNQQPIILNIIDESHLKGMVEFINRSETQQASSFTTEQIEKCERAPVFLCSEKNYPTLDRWQNYLYPIKKIEKSTLFYSLITELKDVHFYLEKNGKR